MASECHTCKKPIMGKILVAMGNKYHPDHFVCFKCKIPITESKFQTHDGNPYCAADYLELFALKCWSCKKPIADKIVTALGHDWHEKHFNCAMCNKNLAGETFMERDGVPLCQDCYQNHFADKCQACGKGVTDKIIVALNAKWHPECFVCKTCKKPITDEMFQVENGLPICSKCASK